jgi:hypothetical protein
MAKQRLNWKKKPETEDYDAASNFLLLICSNAQSKKVLRALREADTLQCAAKDLLRASDLPLLPRDESHVNEELKKVHKGKALAPVLLVRGDLAKGIPLTVADGYHRICATYYYDENAAIPCRIVGM